MNLPLKSDKSCDCSLDMLDTSSSVSKDKDKKYLDDCKNEGVTITYFSNNSGTSGDNSVKYPQRECNQTIYAPTPSTKVFNSSLNNHHR